MYGLNNIEREVKQQTIVYPHPFLNKLSARFPKTKVGTQLVQFVYCMLFSLDGIINSLSANHKLYF